MPRRYPPPMAAHVATARAYPQLWRVALCFVAALVGFRLAVGLLIFIGPPPAWTPLGAFLRLAIFGGMLGGVWIAARLLHGRRLRDLAGRLNVSDFIGGLAIALLVGLLPLFFIFDFRDVEDSLPLSRFLAWLPLAVFAVALQTGTEEVLYRGYLQTQLAARFRSAWAWMVVPSALFAVLHLDFDRVLVDGLDQTDAAILIWAFGLGLACADLTRVSGGISMAWAWHLGINAISVLLVTPVDGASGLGLYQLTRPSGTLFDGLDPIGVYQGTIEMLLLLIGWAALRLRLARRLPPRRPGPWG